MHKNNLPLPLALPLPLRMNLLGSKHKASNYYFAIKENCEKHDFTLNMYQHLW